MPPFPSVKTGDMLPPLYPVMMDIAQTLTRFDPVMDVNLVFPLIDAEYVFFVFGEPAMVTDPVIRRLPEVSSYRNAGAPSVKDGAALTDFAGNV